jgi:ribonuclease BN (tRNA processing enzyme)
VVGDNSYIVDFGPGIVRRATALSKQWEGSFQALDPENLKIAFLTHLHSDHTGGYPDLILTPWVLGRETPLEVYGPKGLTEMTELIIEAYKKDIDYRLEGLEPANQYGWMVNVNESMKELFIETNWLKLLLLKSAMDLGIMRLVIICHSR